MIVPPLDRASSDSLRFQLERLLASVQKEYGTYAVTQDYTLRDSDSVDSLHVDATASSRTISLPSPAGIRRRRVIKTDATANTVTLTAGGTTLINGATTVTLSYQYEFVEVEPTGNAWLVVSRGTLTPSFNSITFPATQVPSSDPNTLDDYEEGTWTPTMTLGGASVGLTYTTQTATYTKIGRLVHIQGRVTLSAKGSSVGNVVLNGLPFANNGTSTAQVPLHSNNLNAGITSPPWGAVAIAGTVMTLIKYATGTTAILMDTDLTDTSDFIFNCCYTA